MRRKKNKQMEGQMSIFDMFSSVIENTKTEEENVTVSEGGIAAADITAVETGTQTSIFDLFSTDEQDTQKQEKKPKKNFFHRTIQFAKSLEDKWKNNLAHAKKAELLEIYAKLVKTINGDDVVYLTNIQKFVDGHGATYISGTVAEPDLSDFEDDFHGNFSEFLTSCFKDRIDWYRISQNEELGKLPHGDVFGEKLELIV